MREGGERTVILVLHAADLVGQRRKEDCRAQRGSSPAADGEKGAPLSLAAQPASVVPHHPTRVHRPSPSSSAPTARSTHSVPRRARSRRFNAAATEWMGIRPEEEEGRRSSRPTDQHRRAPDLPLASSPHGPPGVGVAAQAVRAIVTVRRAASRRRHRSPRRAKGNLTGRAGGGRGGAAAGE
uniref:Uncharacterized protein n=1 Tax=Oryza rufipogon TaxID=4529 RepID=A0A0E0R019_ORYRU